MSDMMINIGRNAKKACSELARLSFEKRDEILVKVANDLIKNSEKLINANKADYEKGVENNMSEGLLDRLILNEKKIKEIADGLIELSELSSPLGEVIDSYTNRDGLQINKVRVPLGVVGIIYESRPNVTADAFGITFKTGNACILRGGSDAINSIIAMSDCIRETLLNNGINPDAIQVIKDTDRQYVNELMKLKEYVDVLIPRGGAGLIKTVVENSTVPVIETGSGNCHIYIDKDADLEKAVPIIINAKTQRLGVCNAAESLCIHKDILGKAMPVIFNALKEKNVEVRGDKQAREICPDIIPATEDDFYTEYLDRIISVKTVNDLDEAISHINEHNTKHSDSIITENKETAERFLNEIDSACVYHNASTRFTDGFVFGLGAEIGISTQKLHARGPMGLLAMTTYKYLIYGNGQIRK